MPASGFSRDNLSAEERHQIESLLVQFDQGWHEKLLPAAIRQLADHPLRRLALIEMIKIDVRRRWQQGKRVLVEGYLKHYPELGTADTIPLDLIAAEYQVRCQFGGVDLEQYAKRFPRQFEALKQHLGQTPGVASGAQAMSKPTLSLHASTQPRARAGTPPELPQQFGRYRIEKKLGQGGMGAVYLAHDTQLDRRVALKVPQFTASDGPDVLERFYREARAAATIEHPNICPVFDVGEIDGTPYVTMSYIEGHSLAEVIQGDRALPQRPVAAIIRKLALALEVAHRRGIIHRDLKPSNVMINERKEPVVMDFGLARRINKDDARITKSGAILGTPAYMSPEQVRGEGKEGPATDIYSLGVILYEMLTGQLPFQGPVAAILGQIMTQEPQPPSALRADIEPDLEAICRKAMAKRVEERYRTMGECATALTQYLRGEAGATTSPAKPAGKQPGGRAGSGPATTEPALATDLLAKLVDRLEAADKAKGGRKEDDTQRTRWWAPLLAACVVLALAMGIVYVANRGTPNVKVENNVVVTLQGLPPAKDPTVIFILDGKVISREELEKPVRLRAGEVHELVMKRGDTVLESRKFAVGQGDTVVNPFEQQVAQGKDDPKPPPTSATSPPPTSATSPPPTSAKPPPPIPAEPSDAVKPLIAQLNDEDVLVRVQAALSLNKLGDRSAVPALMQRIADDLWTQQDFNSVTSAPPSSKAAALLALQTLAKEQETEALVLATKAKTKEVREWACINLEAQKDPAAVACLVSMLQKDPVPRVREVAAKSLVASRPPAVKALAQALFDEEVLVRWQAGRTLEALGDTRIPPAIVKEVAAGAVPALMQRIADDLWTQQDFNSVTSAPPSSKAAALLALQVLEKEKVPPALIQALTAKKPEVRIWACQRISDLRDKESVAALTQAATADPSPDVRKAAAEALSKRK
jgi:HEAT repeat protein/predicted Ser/Thr protein kinase